MKAPFFLLYLFVFLKKKKKNWAKAERGKKAAKIKYLNQVTV